MIDFIKTKKNYILALSVLFVMISLSDPTYSLFLKSESTEKFNYNTGLLDLQFVEDEQISIENAFPTIDSDGIKQEPYKLTIKNTGSLPYLFDLKMLSSTDENVIDGKYIKFQVNGSIPTTLYKANNTIASDLILYPNEELSFNVKVWLDNSANNDILGKKFNAKIVTEGTSIYKTLDQSGANHPTLNNELIPVYYDEKSETWKKADNTNLNAEYTWYNYDSAKWANSIDIKNSDKMIFDITNTNNIKDNDYKFNDGNIIIDNKYLDLTINNYNYDKISNIFRIKFDNLDEDKIYIISNDKMSYYYNNITKKFIMDIDGKIISSKEYSLEKNTWYILGYTYDGNKVSFYINGANLSKENLTGSINSNVSFKIGTNKDTKNISKITIGDIYIYNSILSNSDISKNFKESINLMTDNLVAGYNQFYPMTLKEYYKNSTLGITIKQEDISKQYVWIPRFKYKVWNITGESNIDAYDAYNKGIEISFENSKNSTGNIYCKELECYSDDSLNNKVTNSDNGKYYTHPAFENLGEAKIGFWVSKYEISTSSLGCNEANTEGCLSSELPIESKSGNYAWSNNYLSNFYQAIKKINLNSQYHMIKNTEWGAIAYLSHSKYGVCQDKCINPEKNNTHISGKNSKDTTTNNIYGVFDMNGSTGEFVMANLAGNDNQLNLNNTHFSGIPIANNDYDLYKENKFILGDATRELLQGNQIWNNNSLSEMNSQNNWLIRGGTSNLENTDMFNYKGTTDIASNDLSTRIIIK